MTLAQDIRFAFRMLGKNPLFAASAIAAAALGIGATSAIYTMIDGVLLRPLPFPQSDRIVNVWETSPARNLPRLPAAPGNYYDWRAQEHSFSSIGGYEQSTFNIQGGGPEPERFLGAICDPGFFSVFGVPPLLGRTFTSDEDQPGRDGVIVLGYSLWQQRFGADPSVIGRALILDGQSRIVIGVMPRGFEYPPQAVMWAPLGYDPPTHSRRDLHRTRVIARLKDGVTLKQARAEMHTIHSHLAASYPMFNKDESTETNLMLDDMVGTVRPALLLLLAAVAAVLLIACANIANLLLAKAAAREREIAIRSSLGAPRFTIIRQMLTESVVLSMLGGGAGLLFAYVALHALIAVAPATLPRLNEIHLNSTVMGLAALLSVATGILFGLAPAWHASRTEMHSLIKEGSRSTGTRNPLRSALVVAQVAITATLLVGAGLLIRSFYEIEGVDPGFKPDNLMTMRLAPALYKYEKHEALQIQLARNILHNVSALPGVRSTAISTDVPLLGNARYIMRFEGRPPVLVSQAPVANFFSVTPGFFDTMGMRLLRGRTFTDSDDAKSPYVVVVNQALVDRYFKGQDPIGKRLEIGFATPPRWREIVGIVADVRISGLDQDSPVQAYVAYQQTPGVFYTFTPAITVLARTTQDPASLGSTIKQAILNADRSQPVYALQPMTQVVSDSIAQRRLALILLVFFAASALLLAGVGIYGVLSYVVSQRTSEIGIRMALGARESQVLLDVERHGMLLVLVGLAVGGAGALLLSRFMTSLLFRVNPRDPLTFGIAAATLIGVSILACYIPARRASRVDPLVALRSE